MQKEAEEKRRMQHEFDKKKRRKMGKLAEKFVKWEDQDQPRDYLIRFEDTI
jgi:aminoglycoside N3'-acetyltransferase